MSDPDDLIASLRSDIQMLQSMNNALSGENAELHKGLMHYRQKWYESRRYLRAANKGAERLARVAELYEARATLRALKAQREQQQELQ